jgi:methionyl-tRNA formyltransferase
MRVIFAGTPEFSVPALEALIDAGHDVVAVYTQPDRQSGRGRKKRPSPVKLYAQNHGLVVEQPTTMKGGAERMKEFSADVMVVVAYGVILPADILQIPRYGCLNIHASLLPRWRGAAPIQRAIEAGDTESGITIMQMDAGLDTGEILASYPVNIKPSDTAESLHDRLALTGAFAITDVLANLSQYQENSTPQQTELATYAKKICRDEANIDWTENCDLLARRIRAFNPWPGSQTWYKGIKLQIWQAECCNEGHQSEPGVILSADRSGIKVACGCGVLQIQQLQRPGGKPLRAADFLNGMPLDTGTTLKSTADD